MKRRNFVAGGLALGIAWVEVRDIVRKRDGLTVIVFRTVRNAISHDDRSCPTEMNRREALAWLK